MGKATRQHGSPRLRRLFTSGARGGDGASATRGDVIAGQIGAGAQGAIGKNILQNVTVVITGLPFLAVALLVGAGVAAAIVTHHPTTHPPKMSGVINIAVARFAVQDVHGHAIESTAGAVLANLISNALTKTTAAPSLASYVQVRQIGPITKATSAQRVQTAARAAYDNGADIILYGTITVDAGTFTSNIVPEMYLSPQHLQESEELLGHYAFTQIPVPGDISANPTTSILLSQQLQQRAHALALFILGAGYYENGIIAPTSAGPTGSRALFDKASEYLKAAQASPGWADRDGKEVLYLFLGSTEGQLGNLEAAQAAYTQAVTINPNYARALVGLAEVRFQQSKGGCPYSQRVDAAGLRETLRLYRRALQARVQPAQSEIQTWIAFGLGKTYLCLSQGRVANHWGDSTQAFTRVVAAYRAGTDPRMREMAAQAHGGLGWVYLLAPRAVARYSHAMYGQCKLPWKHTADMTIWSPSDRAIYEFCQAIQLTLHRNLQGVYYGNLGYIYGQLKEYSQARAAYAEAIDRDPNQRDRAWYKIQLQQIARQQASSAH